MGTQSLAYDHPAYRVPGCVAFITTAGNGSVGARFTAFADMLIKSAQCTVVTAGTSATTGHGLTFRSIKGQGTATTSVGSVALNTQTAAVTTNVEFSGSGVSLLRGESITATNGTDATGVVSVTYEYVLQPGAGITD